MVSRGSASGRETPHREELTPSLSSNPLPPKRGTWEAASSCHCCPLAEGKSAEKSIGISNRFLKSAAGLATMEPRVATAVNLESAPEQGPGGKLGALFLQRRSGCGGPTPWSLPRLCIPPRRDRAFVKPHGEATAIDQRPIVLAPVADPIAKDVVGFGHGSIVAVRVTLVNCATKSLPGTTKTYTSATVAWHDPAMIGCASALRAVVPCAATH